MKRLSLSLFFCLNRLVFFAQPTVFNVLNLQLHYPIKIIELDNKYVICNSPNGNNYQLQFTDTLGNDLYTKTYGTPDCLLDYATKNSDSEIMLIGHSFWQMDSTISGNYKGYITITDLAGNEKRSFFLYDSTTLFNRPYNGIYYKNSYYFVGFEYNNTLFPHERMFACKTDTMGNITWYTSNFVQNRSISWPHYGIEISYKENSILLGASYLDSISGGSIEYHSYLLNEIDTNGNFIQRIGLPNMNNLLPCPCPQNINQISRLPDNKYGIAASENFFILDSMYTVIESDTNLYNLIGGFFGNKHLTENSISYGGYKGFMKLYNGDTIFTRTFENEPDIISLEDLIPTKDGGYIGIIHNLGATRIIKLDCEGNYINPQWCSPVLVHNIVSAESKWELYPNPTGSLLFINNRKGILKQLYNSVGQLLFITFDDEINLSSYAHGVYYLRCMGQSKKVIVE